MPANPPLRRRILYTDATFDLTPMIDVTFLLIIFFMCVTEMTRVEFENLTLPRATQAVEDTPQRNREVINITYDPDQQTGTVRSEIVVRRRVFRSADELAEYLRFQARAAPADAEGRSTLHVKIRADGCAEYQKVQRALAACMKAQIHRVSIGAAPQER